MIEPSPPPSAGVVFGDRITLARRYRDALATAGIDRGLIGPREVPRLWDRHIVNCAVIGEAIDADQSVIDIGSGAGLPGIPLAIARPDLSVTLIEPLLRRATFLEEVVAELGLRVQVVRGRAEEKSVLASVAPADVVTSRAVAPLDRLVGWSAPHIVDGGRLVAIKGSTAAEEIKRDREAARRRGVVDLAVVRCGVDLVDPATTLVVGTKRPPDSARTERRGRAGRTKAPRDRRV
ncbi:MAG: 16S rRNA (guanine(527)-N(7))-methyltransferase RsmG [Gordonia sp. (in: high G+C Gram-positive bacteria)]